ncbi:MAG: phosphonopyruvate decarboxylase [Spirochaetales bacterium]|jgi:phosphonopyruvate decarboxylase|nr:phosphonopyruvate decarboxylase [Spirochaetales bacterium]
MINAEVFVQEALKKGFGLWTGVPCSYLKPLINYVISDPGVRYVNAVNEGDAVAIACGAALAGLRGVVMFQNSGLGNAVNPLSSLNHVFQIPVLLIVTLRGEPGGPPDEPQHSLMGPITTAMLDVMKIRWEYFPVEDADSAAALDRAARYMDEAGLPFAFVMRKDSAGPVKLKSDMCPRPPAASFPAQGFPVRQTACLKRRDMLKALRAALRTGDVVLATTGFTGRELYALGDTENQFYMAGSMGCLVSLALGIALVQPRRRVIALDGDGAFLMRMGALAAVGYERPKNLVHIVFDNEHYESTGNQSTISASVDALSIAAACGYERIEDTASADGLADILKRHTNDALVFVRAGIQPGTSGELPRPKITPVEAARRFANYLKKELP